jgi:oligopeptide/dipeptide ABC transporter ATP-binding protein
MKPLLQVENLQVHYPIRGDFFQWGRKVFLKAVQGVSFEINQGEVLGLVGESGCGKSSLGRALLRLHEPTAGNISVCGTDFLSLKGGALREFRPNIQMVFQDPYASLDPRMTVFDILAEPLQTHHRLSAAEVRSRVEKNLDRVGLANKALNKYPHEFSGGQRQRIAIGRALILEPKVLVADEPVSSLDVSVQAQILNLLKDIQREMSLSMLFISHNLAVVKYISDRIAVMYLGKTVETATKEDLYRSPQHPYTQALISAVPLPDPKRERERKRIPLTGELPSPLNPPRGCAFHTRCPIAVEHCKSAPPPLDPVGNPTWKVACYEVKR